MVNIKRVERTINGELYLFDYPQNKKECNFLIEMALDFGGYEFLVGNHIINITEEGVTINYLNENGTVTPIKNYVPSFWEEMVTTGEVTVTKQQKNEFYNTFYQYLNK